MPSRNADLRTLALMGCCLVSIGKMAYGNTVTVSPSTHHNPVTTAAPPMDVPRFEPGLWQYRRTVMGDDSPARKISVLRKCADPSTEIRRKMADLEKRSCQFAPLAHRHNRYLSSWTCPTPLGPTRFSAVLIVRGSAGYTDLSEMRSAQHSARQRIDAVRIGECSTNGLGDQFR